MLLFTTLNRFLRRNRRVSCFMFMFYRISISCLLTLFNAVSVCYAIKNNSIIAAPQKWHGISQLCPLVNENPFLLAIFSYWVRGSQIRKVGACQISSNPFFVDFVFIFQIFDGADSLEIQKNCSLNFPG